MLFLPQPGFTVQESRGGYGSGISSTTEWSFFFFFSDIFAPHRVRERERERDLDSNHVWIVAIPHSDHVCILLI